MNEHLKGKRKKLKAEPSPEIVHLNSADTGKLLKTGEFQPIPSVVDETTELLPIEARTRKF